MPNLSHDRNQCIHCGACVSVCPEFFEDNGEISLKNAVYENNIARIEISEDKKESAQSSVSVCPVSCITLE